MVRFNFNTKATVDKESSSLICRECEDKYCTYVDKEKTVFCPSFKGSRLVTEGKYMVQCSKHLGGEYV